MIARESVGVTGKRRLIKRYTVGHGERRKQREKGLGNDALGRIERGRERYRVLVNEREIRVCWRVCQTEIEIHRKRERERERETDRQRQIRRYE